MSERIIAYPELKEILPCNNAMMLVDRVCVINENKVVGLKAITLDELFVLGHGIVVVEKPESGRRADIRPCRPLCG